MNGRGSRRAAVTGSTAPLMLLTGAVRRGHPPPCHTDTGGKVRSGVDPVPKVSSGA